ncbi:hypothetical protein D3C77_563310 [compost metagenome]
MGQQVDANQILGCDPQPARQVTQPPMPQPSRYSGQVTGHTGSPVVFTQDVEVVVPEDTRDDAFGEFR